MPTVLAGAMTGLFSATLGVGGAMVSTVGAAVSVRSTDRRQRSAVAAFPGGVVVVYTAGEVIGLTRG